jgi:hypothetical protein
MNRDEKDTVLRTTLLGFVVDDRVTGGAMRVSPQIVHIVGWSKHTSLHVGQNVDCCIEKV